MKKRTHSKPKKTKAISPVDEAAAFAVEQDIAVLLSTLVGKLSTFENKLDAVLNRITSTPTAVIPAPQIQPQRPPQPARHHERPMYAVVCYECGQDCEIPFKPSGNRPVYCKVCFAKRKNRPQPNIPVPSTAPSLNEQRTGTSPKAKTAKKTVTKKTAAKKRPVTKKNAAPKKKAATKKKPAPKKKAPAKKTAKKKKSKR